MQVYLKILLKPLQTEFIYHINKKQNHQIFICFKSNSTEYAMDHINEIFTDSYSRSENQSQFLPNPLFAPGPILEETRIETPTSTTAGFISEANPIPISSSDQQYIQSDNSGVVFNDIVQLINLVSVCQTEDGMTGKAKFKDGFIFLENLKTHFDSVQTDIIERDVRIATLLKENDKLKQDKKQLNQKNQTIFLQFGMLRKKYAKLDSEIKMRENKTGKQFANISSVTEPLTAVESTKLVSIGTSADLQNLNSIPLEHQGTNMDTKQIERKTSNSTLVNSAQPKINQTNVR